MKLCINYENHKIVCVYKKRNSKPFGNPYTYIIYLACQK